VFLIKRCIYLGFYGTYIELFSNNLYSVGYASMCSTSEVMLLKVKAEKKDPEIFECFHCAFYIPTCCDHLLDHWEELSDKEIPFDLLKFTESKWFSHIYNQINWRLWYWIIVSTNFFKQKWQNYCKQMFRNVLNDAANTNFVFKNFHGFFNQF
jgi:hypothetical protein